MVSSRRTELIADTPTVKRAIPCLVALYARQADAQSGPGAETKSARVGMALSVGVTTAGISTFAIAGGMSDELGRNAAGTLIPRGRCG